MVCEKLGVDSFVIINDFGAVGHAVAQAGPEHFQHLTGPDQDFASDGTLSIIGPGTGLGVAHVWRKGSAYHVQATQGGHIDFAPLDAIEDAVLARLRKRYRRVSIERVVSGPGLVDLYETLAAIEGRAVQQYDDKILWQMGMSGADSLAAAAVDLVLVRSPRGVGIALVAGEDQLVRAEGVDVVLDRAHDGDSMFGVAPGPAALLLR